ncbi:MAG TPA: hypothetical protein VFN41_01100 [Candidatus Limnocylindrales bacterium]|nr:hypothetical protein [Candidatus Limnocylindrales bacterium]
MQRRGDDQPTVFTDAAAAAQTQTPTQTPSAKLEASAAPLPRGIARRTGVVFVHGIGTQGPGETFLDWSGAIVELLTDWRAAEAAVDAPPGVERIDDPVWRAEFTFNAASPPYLELGIPEHAGVPATTWVLTEAWWASDLRPPDLGTTIDYLRRRIATVVSGISAGYRDRSPRLEELAQATEVIGEPPPLDWRLAEDLDRVQSSTFGARPVGWLVAGGGVVALAGYDLLRRVPIPVVRDFAIRRMIDSFLVDWFGDLPVLLDEPVQSANVRARLARSIQRLVDDGCDAIVVVAHSGGALVSFETLLDPAYIHLPVDKLVTLGQGLGLSWRLAEDPDVREITPGSRLVGNLAEVRPGMHWVDVWASFDPAPAGPIPPREPWLLPAPVALPGEPPPTPPPGTILVESRPVTNEMNVLTDHGAYWANPEGFLIPLVRHIDAASGDAGASRFYRDRTDRTLRIVWRRQRVSALAAWGWLCALAAIGTALALVLLQVAGQPRLSDAGDLLVAVWDRVPGHELISAPVSAFEAVVGGLLEFVGLGKLADTLAGIGPVLLGLALVGGLFYLLAKIGLGRWHDWDRRERRAMHPETPVLPDRSKAGAQAMALVGGLLGLVFAVFGWAAAAGIAIVLGAAAGLFVWARRPFASDGRPLRPPA